MTLTPEEILAGTRVLAEFDGWKHKACYPNDWAREYEKDGTLISDFAFTYHSSRDAFWPVWERFSGLDQSQFTEAQLCDFLQHGERIGRALAFESIGKAFTLLVKGVEWYNQQTLKQKTQ